MFVKYKRKCYSTPSQKILGAKQGIRLCLKLEIGGEKIVGTVAILFLFGNYY